MSNLKETGINQPVDTTAGTSMFNLSNGEAVSLALAYSEVVELRLGEDHRLRNLLFFQSYPVYP
jgi:hypothetical protein